MRCCLLLKIGAQFITCNIMVPLTSLTTRQLDSRGQRQTMQLSQRCDLCDVYKFTLSQ